MASSLVQQLAARLSVNEVQAAQALNALVSRIHTELAKEGTAHVPALGRFQLQEDALSFDPDPTLAEAANYAFAGLEAEPVTAPAVPAPAEETAAMAPLEAVEPEAARPAPGFAMESDLEEQAAVEEQEATTPEAEILASEEEAPATERSTPYGEEQWLEEDLDTGAPLELGAHRAAEDTTEAPDEAEAHRRSGASEEATDAAGEEAPATEGERSQAGETAAAIAATREEPVAETPRPSDTPRPADDRPPTSASEAPAPDEPRGKSSSVLRIVGTVGILLVLLVGGYLLFSILGTPDGEPSSSSPVAEEQSSSPQADESEATAEAPPPITESNSPDALEDNPTSDTEVEDAADPEEPNPDAASEDVADPSQAPSDGQAAPEEAEPSMLNPATGGWTLVVASATSRSTAQADYAAYRESTSGLNLPLGILSSRDNGTTRYRVGIGQFASLSELQEAQQRLGDQLPGDAWPLRIESSMQLVNP